MIGSLFGVYSGSVGVYTQTNRINQAYNRLRSGKLSPNEAKSTEIELETAKAIRAAEQAILESAQKQFQEEQALRKSMHNSGFLLA